MREKFKPGDKVHLKGDWRTYEVREVHADGFIKAVEITADYDKIGLFRDASLFEKSEKKISRPIISILGSKEKELITEYEATKQEIPFGKWVRRKAEDPETLSWLFDDGYITCYDDLDAQQRRDLEAFIERLKDEQEN